MSKEWNVINYTKFIEQRTLPAKHLLAAIPNDIKPKIIWDLGCGSGNSTIILKELFKNATVSGMDASSNMINEAKSLYPDINFVTQKIADFNPKEKIDLLFSNAALHWIENLENILNKLISFINTNGLFYFQIPNNFHAPSHQIAYTIISSAIWNHLTKYLPYGKLNKKLYDFSEYYSMLKRNKLVDIKCWETTYYHEMNRYEDIYEWIRGSSLNIILSKMNEEENAEFKELYIRALRSQYSMESDGKILLPFNRLFCGGRKSE